MLSSRLVLPLALLFILVGCRDALVDANLPSSEPLPVTEQDAMYLKGPNALALDETGLFRAQHVEGATEYSWFFQVHETGRLSGTVITDSNGFAREFSGTAIEPGVVTINVSAVDGDNRVLASASRRVVISVQ